MRCKSIAAIAGLIIAAGGLAAPAQAAPKAPALSETVCAAQVGVSWESYTYTFSKGMKTCTLISDTIRERSYATQQPYSGQETHLVGVFTLEVPETKTQVITQKAAKPWVVGPVVVALDFEAATFLGYLSSCWERYWFPGWSEIHPEWNWATRFPDLSVCEAAGLFDVDANGNPTAEPWDEVR
jgi:hypothetical protein